MEDAMGMLHRQERALRAIEAVAISGFAVDSQGLKASCLTICNTCRECVPLGLLRIDWNVPSTLLAVIWPEFRHAEDQGASRVLRPRQVLKVDWEFDDPTPTHTVESEGGGVEEKEDEDGHDENGEQEEENKQEKKEEGKADTTRKEEEAEEENEEQEEEEQEEEEERKDEKDERWIVDKYSDEEEVERGQVTAYKKICISKVLWPKGVKEISLGRFNRPVDGVAWPEGLEVLCLHMPSRLFRGGDVENYHGGIFNRPLDGVVFPAGLREIFLGFKFNQCIDAVAWPEGLERLSLPGFNQSIQNVQWPSGLKTLEFITPYQFEIRESSDKVPWTVNYGGFDQPLSTFLPLSLETLWLSDDFDQSLRGVTWPNGLAVLGLGVDISQESIVGVTLPLTLQKVVCSCYNAFLPNVHPACRVVTVEEYNSDMDEHESDHERDMDEYEESDHERNSKGYTKSELYERYLDGTDEYLQPWR